MALFRSWSKPVQLSTQIALLAVTSAVYVLLFFTLYPIHGLAMGALAALPVMAAAWFWGGRASLVAVLVIIPVNTILFNLTDVQPGGWDVILTSGAGVGMLMLLVVGLVVGRLSDLDGRLKRELLDRQLAETALSGSEQRFRALIEHSSDAISLLGADGRLAYVSPSTTRLLGYAVDDVTGKPLTKMIHPDDEPAMRALLHDLTLRPSETVNAQFRVRHQDGSWRWLESFISNRVADPAINAIVFNYRDITDRKQRESELLVLVGVGAALRSVTSRSEMGAAILDQLMKHLNAQGAVLEILQPLSGEFITELGVGIWAGTTGDIIPPGQGISAQVLGSGLPYINNDAINAPDLRYPHLLGACRAIAAAPLIAEGGIIGLLWMGTERALNEHDLHVLTAIADAAAGAIHRETMHERAVRQLQRMAALREIDKTIAGSVELRLTLSVILAQTRRQLNADAVSILLFDKRLMALQYAAGDGFRTPAFEKSKLIKLGEGYAGRAALERRSVYIPDLAARPDNPRLMRVLASEHFVSYYAIPLMAKGQVKGVIEIFQRSLLVPDAEWLSFFEALAGQTAIAVESVQLFDGLQRSNVELSMAYDATIEGWSRAMDLRDKETEGHTLRVTEMSLQLAAMMAIQPDELVHMRRGALLHDMGKMGVPDGILLKPDKLTDDEWELMRKHPQYAYEMLSPIDYLRRALDIPYCHHEKWDGTGYPRGLKGAEIPLAARIFAVADVWDALRSDRPYRQGWPEAQVRAHIKALAGSHFDPQVVNTFLQMTTG